MKTAAEKMCDFYVLLATPAIVWGPGLSFFLLELVSSELLSVRLLSGRGSEFLCGVMGGGFPPSLREQQIQCASGDVYLIIRTS